MPRANRRCHAPGCDQLAPCDTHTAAPWASSSRRITLPPNWSAIRAAILERDQTCQLAYPDEWHTARGPARCAGLALEVDHIGAPDDHRPKQLRGVCPPCHRRRTQAQSAAARRRTR